MPLFLDRDVLGDERCITINCGGASVRVPLTEITDEEIATLPQFGPRVDDENVSVLQRHRTHRRVHWSTFVVAKQTVRQPAMMMPRMDDGDGQGGRRLQRQ